MSVASATGYTSVRDAAGELSERSPGLFAVAAINFCLFAVMAAIAPFDGRSVLGLNPWIKPMKFALSIAIYTATVGWFIQYLRLEERTKRWITWGIGGAMLVEIAVITFQGARAVPSHFNFSTVFDVALNGIMVTMILLNTVLVAYLLVRFWRTDPSLAPAYLWGVRLGFLVFFLASLEGFAMIGQGAHTVGAPDGGPGLPFVNWSTTAGDLRIAHFVGMHSFQTIPLVGYVLAGVADRGWLTRSVALVWTYAISHASVALAVFVVALTGQPLVSL
jgi:hypothetical protein